MSANLSTPNTSPTPSQPGPWLVTEFGTPAVLRWETIDFNTELSDVKVLVGIIVGGYPHPLALKPGFATGYDLVGEVIALGKSVPKESGFTLGDRVTALSIIGAHATHILLPYTELMKIDPKDDPDKIAALPLNYTTAWEKVKHSGVQIPPGGKCDRGEATVCC
ncbi:Nn.00g056430.m01.CDS01 [Neocucurbitaria sp. VM-36]